MGSVPVKLTRLSDSAISLRCFAPTGSPVLVYSVLGSRGRVHDVNASRDTTMRHDVFGANVIKTPDGMVRHGKLRSLRETFHNTKIMS